MPLDTHIGGGGQRQGPHSKTLQHWCNHSARLWPHGIWRGLFIDSKLGSESSAFFCPILSVCLPFPSVSLELAINIEQNFSCSLQPLFPYSGILFTLFVYVYECFVCVYICLCEQTPTGTRRVHRISWEGIPQLGATMWVLGTKLGSTARATSALNL